MKEKLNLWFSFSHFQNKIAVRTKAVHFYNFLILNKARVETNKCSPYVVLALYGAGFPYNLQQKNPFFNRVNKLSQHYILSLYEYFRIDYVKLGTCCKPRLPGFTQFILQKLGKTRKNMVTDKLKTTETVQ